MIFNKNKIVKIQYFINANSLDLDAPNSLFPNIIKYDSNAKTGCPSVSSLNNKIYKVLSPTTTEVELNVEDNDLKYKYEFDESVLRTDNRTHNILQTLLHTETNQHNFKDFQHLSPYIFVTDDKEIEITTMPYPLEQYNLEFIAGSFKPYSWLRNINGSWKLINEKEKATIKFILNEPMFLLLFNKPVELEYITPTKDMLDYYAESKHIVNIRKNLKDIYNTVQLRRPNKLLK